MSARRVILVVVAVVAVVVILRMLGGLIAPPLDQRTVRLGIFLRNEGVEVASSRDPGSTDGTAILLQDFRGPAQADELVDWAESGGSLVVADPASEVLPAMGVEVDGTVGGLNTDTLSPGCLTAETDGIEALDVYGFEASLHSDDPAAVRCFQVDKGSYMLRETRGSGQIIVLGGTSFLEDDQLAEANNAAFLLRLVGSEKKVTMLSAVPPEGVSQGGFWSTLPAPIRMVLLQLLVAVIVYAVVRGRRLGRIPSEAPLVPISATELVRARAGLYRQARARGHASQMVRSATRSRIMSRVGGTADEPTDAFAMRVASATDLETDAVKAAFDASAPKDDIVLTTQERVMERIARRTEGVE